MSGQEDLD